MQFSRYQIVRELGRGAMGIVYLAHDPKIDRPVALKVLREDRLASQSYVQRFMKEAKAIGRVSHPGIVTVYDVGQDQDAIYIAMEFIEGESLDKLAQAKGPTLQEVIRMGIQVADTLDYAHSKGVIHRDIKPSNMIIRGDGTVKITDFGIAHLEDPASTQLTQAGEILGTPAYMSPEQVMSRPVDGRSDLYSLGVILYELTTGQRPYRGDNVAALLRAITLEQPRPPAEVRAGIPRDVSQVIIKCLSKSPEGRYSTGKALSAALAQCALAIGPGPRQDSRDVRYGVIALASSLLLIATLASAIIYVKGAELKATLSYWFSPFTPAKPAVVPVLDSPKQPGNANEIDPARRQPSGREPRTPETGTPPSPVSPPTSEHGKMGYLNLESTPPGADVFVDGSLRGQTPLSLELNTGKHEVKVAMEKHYDWTARVLLEGGDVPVHVRLHPMP